MTITAVRLHDYRPELDGIRALAVLAVILYHFSSSLLPGGFLGVDMFFVLSGYVVSGSLAQRDASNWLAFLGGFYARRMRRILPGLLFCIVVSSVAACLFIRWPREQLLAAMSALYGAGNFYFYSHAQDYFGESTQHNPFTHTWSLGVEEQFYVVLPLLLLMTRGSPWRRIMALSVMSAASIAWWWWATQHDTQAAFYLLPARFWELGLGCLLNSVERGWPVKVPRWFAEAIGAAALATLAACICVPFEFSVYTMPAACLAVVGLIFAMQTASTVVGAMSAGWLVRIGVLSYSLYLWHWPLLVISRFTIGISYRTALAQAVILAALATLSFVYVERPLRYVRIAMRDGAVVLAGLVMVASVYGVVTYLDVLPNKLYVADRPTFDISRPVLAGLNECVDASDFDAKTFPPPCYLNTGASHTLWMIGDSTIWALKGLAGEFKGRTGFNIAMFAQDSAFPSVRLNKGQVGNPRLVADAALFEKAFAYAAGHAKPGDVVLVGGNIADRLCAKPELFCLKLDPIGNVNHKFDVFLDEMHELDQRVRKHGAQLVIVGPLPRWTRDHRVFCDRQWFRPDSVTDQCHAPAYEDQLRSRARIINRLNEAHAATGLLFYDPFPFVCNATACDFSDPSTNVNFWIDETHLSTRGGQRLAPDFRAFLQRNELLR